MRFSTGAGYRYKNCPVDHFHNTVTAKDRTEAIGNEKPGSEGSYLIHNVIGKDRNNRPYEHEKLTDAEVARIFPAEEG